MGLPRRTTFKKVEKNDVQFLNGYYTHIPYENFKEFKDRCIKELTTKTDHKFVLHELQKNIKDLEPEYSNIVDKNYWELFN